MAQRILVAGATGAIGKRLMPLLVAAGHEVFGTTRSEDKAQALQAAGVTPVVVDVFDRTAVSSVLARIRPEIAIHQLTDLPLKLEPSNRSAALARNARLREEGTRNLVDAALSAQVQRMIAQSIAWGYAPGPQPYTEDRPLDLDADGERGITIEGVATLERLVLSSPPLAGIVLRYGQLYGPGTARDEPAGSAPLHVDAAAYAAALAVGRGASGTIFNIAEETGFVSIDRARRELGWQPSFRALRT